MPEQFLISMRWKAWPQGIAIAVVGNVLFTLDLFDSLLGREPNDLVEGEGDCPHAMNTWLSKDDVVG